MKKFYFFLITLFAVNGTIAQWIPQNSGTSNNLNYVYFTDADTGYAIGDSGTILKTTDGGDNWSIQSSGLLKSLRSVFFTSSNEGYIVGDSGTILKTINGGVSWEFQISGITDAITSVHFPEPNTGYAVGGTFLTGTILKTTDGGTNWTIIKSDSNITLSSVFFTNVNTGYAVGTNGWMSNEGLILRTTNGGTDWIATVFNDYYGTGFHTVCFPEANIGYVVGGCCGPGTIFGILYKSTDAGENWTGQEWINVSAMGAGSIHFLNADTGFVTSAYGSGAIFKTTNGGVNLTGWITPTFSYPSLLNSVYFTDIETGYVVGEGGTILKTTDGGGFPVGTSDVSDKSSVFKIFPNPSSDQIAIEFFGEGQLSILNVTGQEILKQIIVDHKTQIDITGLSDGVYFIKLIEGNTVQIEKLIKQ
jgi:photosystem II stability/assembly factor-like uncharacterized protein